MVSRWRRSRSVLNRKRALEQRPHNLFSTVCVGRALFRSKSLRAVVDVANDGMSGSDIRSDVHLVDPAPNLFLAGVSARNTAMPDHGARDRLNLPRFHIPTPGGCKNPAPVRGTSDESPPARNDKSAEWILGFFRTAPRVGESRAPRSA